MKTAQKGLYQLMLVPLLLLRTTNLLHGEMIEGNVVVFEAERLEGSDVARKNFGGVPGVLLNSKKSIVRTSFELSQAREVEVWARVYFPWHGQDLVRLQVDDRELKVTARNENNGGRWDIGNFQVWHWYRAGRLSLDAGEHLLAIRPGPRPGERVDKVILYYGNAPAWTQAWRSGGRNSPVTPVRWRRGDALEIDASSFHETGDSLARWGDRIIAVMERDAQEIGVVVRNRRPRIARLWARVYFEGKNMFEGLSMEEMAGNLYITVDGELRKTVYEQNGRQWHWVSTDRPVSFAPGYHYISLSKQGPSVRFEKLVLYAGDSPQSESWFRAIPPPQLPFGLGRGQFAGRAGNWRTYSTAGIQSTRFLGKKKGPARFPVEIETGKAACIVDMVRVQGRPYPLSKGDPTVFQELGIWTRNDGPPVSIKVLYADRDGEFFLQELVGKAHSDGWRYFSAFLPFLVRSPGTYFDYTGYATDSVQTPRLWGNALDFPVGNVIPRRGDRKPDYPIEVLALRIAKPEGPTRLLVGDPVFDSPCTLKIRIGPGVKAAGASDTVSLELTLSNKHPVEKDVVIHYRVSRLKQRVVNDRRSRATYSSVIVKAPPTGTATHSVPLEGLGQGMFVVEARVGPAAPVRRTFAIVDEWIKQLNRWTLALEQRVGAFHFSKDGKDRPLKKRDGTMLTREEVEKTYGAESSLVVKVHGIDVCSLEYAEKQGYAMPLKPRGWDLSDDAGWPDIPIPYGTLAIDPELGRAKFAVGVPCKLSIRSALGTGFGVPGPPVTVRGDYAYAGAGEGHYSVVDCSDPKSPKVISQIASWYFSYKLFLYQDIGFFESSRRGLIMVDGLSDPFHPGALRNVHLDRGKYGRLTHLFESEGIAYFSGPNGITVFDLSEPLYPRPIAALPGASGFVTAARGIAFTYVGDQVRLVDVARPGKPRLLGGGIQRQKSAKGRFTTGIFCADSKFLALRNGKKITLYSYSWDNSLRARRIAEVEIPGKSGRHVFGAFHKGFFYLVDGKHGPGQYSLGATSPASRWFVYELAREAAKQIYVYEHPWPSAFGTITIANDTAYVSDYNYGIWLFDLSDPRRPERMGGAVTAGESDALWLDGNIAYQWQTFGGAVFLIDISDTSAPRRLGEYCDGAWLPYGNSRRGNNTIAGKDGFIYVPRSRKGLVIVDARNPSAPKAIGMFTGPDGKPVRPGGAFIDVWGSNVFLLQGKKLLVYDVSKPDQPGLRGALDIQPADLLCARGSVVYLGNRKGLFQIIDVSNPAAPRTLSSLDLTRFCTPKMAEVISGITVSRGYGYLTARGTRSYQPGMFLHIIDVRVPSKPRWITTYDPYQDLPESPCSLWGDFYQDIICDGDYLFIGNYGQIECFNIENPEAPRIHDVLHVGYQWSVGRKQGPFLFVHALNGMVVINAPTSSQTPREKVELSARF